MIGVAQPTLQGLDFLARLSAIENLVDGSFFNSGQSCCGVERIYVHEKIHDTFVAKFVETVKGFKVGDMVGVRLPSGPDITIDKGSDYLKVFIKFGSPQGMPNWGTSGDLNDSEVVLLQRLLTSASAPDNADDPGAEAPSLLG